MPAVLTPGTICILVGGVPIWRHSAVGHAHRIVFTTVPPDIKSIWLVCTRRMSSQRGRREMDYTSPHFSEPLGGKALVLVVVLLTAMTTALPPMMATMMVMVTTATAALTVMKTSNCDTRY